MNREQLIEIAERCEKATGPDREIDGRIHFATVLAEPWPDDGMRLVAATEQFEDSRDTVARYSSSLDAAMTLVPEGCAFEVTTTGFSPGASVVRPGVNEGAYAATPALALCAAALRARATQKLTTSGGDDE